MLLQWKFLTSLVFSLLKYVPHLQCTAVGSFINFQTLLHFFLIKALSFVKVPKTFFQMIWGKKYENAMLELRKSLNYILLT